MLLSHLDVVPAEPNGWAVDPFGGLVAGGYVVGRGALDAKGLAITHLLAMATLAHRDAQLSRDIIFLATPDEETGGRNGAGFIAREHKDLLRGAEFLLTEGGGILLGNQRRTERVGRRGRRKGAVLDATHGEGHAPGTRRRAGCTVPCRAWCPRSSACAACRPRCASSPRSR